MRILITVKAYPAASQKYHETVCVAGVRIDEFPPRLVRLYPIPFRELPASQQFRKYDIVEVQARDHAGDNRPESIRPDLTTLKIVGHIDSDHGWRERARHVAPLVAPSLCEIKRAQKLDRTSLGVFRPREVLDFKLVPADPRTASREALAGQISLLDPAQETVEILPYRFVYKFVCDNAACRTHEIGLIDWEVGQTYRKWRHHYTADELPGKLREKWLEQMSGPDRDLHFFTGNLAARPNIFMLLGVFYPKRNVMIPQLF